MIKGKTAQYLRKLIELQGDSPCFVLKGFKTFSETGTKLLIRAGVLCPICRSWYMSAVYIDDMPSLWNASCWQFVAQYADLHYKNKWCLSPETTIAFLSGDIPLNLTIYAVENKQIKLYNGTTLNIVKELLPSQIRLQDGLRVLPNTIASSFVQRMEDDWKLFAGQIGKTGLALIKKAVSGSLKTYHSIIRYNLFPNDFYYRTGCLFIAGSQLIPIKPAEISEALDYLFNLADKEENVLVCAVLVYYFYLRISPYRTGNELIARRLANKLLDSESYPLISFQSVENSSRNLAQEIETIKTVFNALYPETLLPYSKDDKGTVKHYTDNIPSQLHNAIDCAVKNKDISRLSNLLLAAKK